MTDYPEHAKCAAVEDKSQTCGEFLEWLQGKYVFATYVNRCPTGKNEYEHLEPVGYLNISNLLSEFFDIDLKKLEAEKEIIFSKLREQPSS